MKLENDKIYLINYDEFGNIIIGIAAYRRSFNKKHANYFAMKMVNGVLLKSTYTLSESYVNVLAELPYKELDEISTTSMNDVMMLYPEFFI